MDQMLEQKTKEESKWYADKDGNLVLEKHPICHGITVKKEFNLEAKTTLVTITEVKSGLVIVDKKFKLDDDFKWAPKNLLK